VLTYTLSDENEIKTKLPIQSPVASNIQTLFAYCL